MRRRLEATALAFLIVVLAVAAAPHSVKGWVLLGQRTVSDRADHDIIAVTGARGHFKQIKLTVQRASVDFHRVVVHYGNGDDQRLELRNTIPAGGETRAIDLEGGERVLKSVEFWYDANTRGRRALVRLWGQD